MTLASLSLVVLAAILHAVWNLLAKRAAAAGAVFVFAYNLFSFAAYAPWVGWILWQGGLHWGREQAGFIVLSSFLHLAYALCLQRGYRVADLSVVYPVARGTGPMLSTIGAFLILGEQPSGAGVIGLVLIVSGILLIATQGRLATFARPEAQAGLRWGTATGGLIAAYTVADAFSVKKLGIAPVLLDWCSCVLRLCLMLPMILRDPKGARDRMRGYWGLAAGVGVLSPLSYILVLAALSHGAPLSTVAPLREMSMMVGALMGMLILREAVSLWRLIGCAVLIGGVILLTAT